MSRIEKQVRDNAARCGLEVRGGRTPVSGRYWFIFSRGGLEVGPRFDNGADALLFLHGYALGWQAGHVQAVVHA